MRPVLFGCVGLLLARTGAAQDLRRVFDVTSVKPFSAKPFSPRLAQAAMAGEPGDLLNPTCPPNGHFMARVMLQPIILWAYGVRDYQLAGMPGWGKEMATSWSIEATTSQGPVNTDQCKLMVQALLADRFRLKFHWEKRDVPVQALVVAKGGPKLRAPTGEPPSPQLESPYTRRNQPGTGARINGYLYKVGLASGQTPDGWTMKDLAALLNIGARMRFENPVVDRTGLEGAYQFDLEFSQPAFPTDRPELGVALQRQLGLKLEHRKEPMDVMVIEVLEKASEN